VYSGFTLCTHARHADAVPGERDTRRQAVGLRRARDGCRVR
jgi:hypothetical protein